MTRMLEASQIYESRQALRPATAFLRPVTVSSIVDNRAMRDGSGRLPLIGRRRELQELETYLVQAEAGRGTVVLVSGDPGIGKTSLVRAFRSRADARGIASISGSANDIDGPEIPFGPIVQALRDGFERGALSPEHLPIGIQEELSQLLPVLAAQPSRRPVAGRDAYARVRLFESVRFALADLSSRSTTIVLLEDLHWADQSTLDLLSFLAHNLEDQRVLVVLTFRQVPIRSTSPVGRWVAELARRSNVQHVDLGPFVISETSALVRSILGPEAGPAMVGLIHDRASGNPFAVQELAAAAANNADDAIPAALRDSILASLGGLGPDARKVVAAAAIIGPPLDDELLPSVAGATPDEVLRGLRELVDVRIVATDPLTGSYDFRHGLTREVAYMDLLVEERRVLHGRAADGLGARRAALAPADRSAVSTVMARIAHHRAAAGDFTQATLASLEAGRGAFEVLAFAEAAAQLRSVVDRWPGLQGSAVSQVDRNAVALEAAEALVLSGDATAAIDMAEAALTRLGDRGRRELRGRLWERLAEYRFHAGRSGRFEAVQCAVRLLPLAAGVERARALIGLGEERSERGEGDGTMRAFRHAVRNARRAGAPGLEAYTGSLAAVQHSGDGIAEAVRLTQETLRLAGTGELPELAGWSYVNLIFFYLMQGRLEDALAAGDEGLALASSLALPESVRALLVMNTADAMVEFGRYAEADRRIRGLVGRSDIEALYRQVIDVRIALFRGDERPATGPESLVAALDHIDPVGSRSRYGLVARAEHALARGDFLGVRAIVADLTSSDVPNAMHAWYEATAYRIGIAAEVIAAARARAGQDERALAASNSAATVLLERARRLEARVASDHLMARLFLATAYAEASRIDGPGDQDAWEALATRWAAVGSPWWTAYSRLRLADAMGSNREANLLRIGDLLKAANSQALTLGAGPLAKEIEATARRLRVRLDLPEVNTGTSDRDIEEPVDPGLSTREREVLALVAEGLTNREIGERLFISPKTAGVHVSNILGKLRAHGRVEAALIAQRAGLTGISPDEPRSASAGTLPQP